MACPEVVTGYVEIQGEDYASIQKAVDAGQNLWRLSPVRTAQEIGTRYLGLRMGDAYTFVNHYVERDSGLRHATVRVKHANCRFIADLYQPVKQGQGGIWVLQSLSPE